MKLATAAYEIKDLAGLLRLEVQWISTHTSSLDNIPDETLKAYSMLLNDEAESYAVSNNPRYAPVLRFHQMNPNYVRPAITNEVRSLKNNQQVLVAWQKDLEDQSLVRPTLKECVEAMLQEEEEDMDLLNMLFR